MRARYSRDLHTQDVGDIRGQGGNQPPQPPGAEGFFSTVVLSAADLTD